MYTLELDVHLCFTPPMVTYGGKIVLTRATELPFVPTDGLAIFSTRFDECPDPMGLKLENVVWDMDRNVFLAQVEHLVMEEPFPLIIEDIRGWIGRGWKLGSYRDQYDPEKKPEVVVPKPYHLPKRLGNELEMVAWPILPARSRPPYFNDAFGILTRVLVETNNAPDVAYAMHHTQTYFADAEQTERVRSPAATRYWHSLQDFRKLSPKKQSRLLDEIIAAYPSLAAVTSG